MQLSGLSCVHKNQFLRTLKHKVGAKMKCTSNRESIQITPQIDLFYIVCVISYSEFNLVIGILSKKSLLYSVLAIGYRDLCLSSHQKKQTNPKNIVRSRQFNKTVVSYMFKDIWIFHVVTLLEILKLLSVLRKQYFLQRKPQINYQKNENILRSM